MRNSTDIVQVIKPQDWFTLVYIISMYLLPQNSDPFLGLPSKTDISIQSPTFQLLRQWVFFRCMQVVLSSLIANGIRILSYTANWLLCAPRAGHLGHIHTPCTLYSSWFRGDVTIEVKEAT